MPPEGFAILASVSFASSQILMKIGTRDTSIIAGLLVSLATGSLVSLIALFLWGSWTFGVGAVVLFAVAGMFGSGFGRILTIVAVDRLGPSVSVPLQGSVYPLSTVLAAMFFLGETMQAVQLLGVAILLSGVWLLSRVEAATPIESEVAEPPRAAQLINSYSSVGRRELLRSGAIFPLLAGLCYAASDILRKRGVEIVPDPIMGTTVGLFTSFVFWLSATLLLKDVRSQVRLGPGVKFFAVSGVFSAAAVLSVIRAFETGDVSVVTPITASQPLPILILSAIFLRGVERITAPIVVGATSVLIGTILISI